jgi:dimethylargininase
MLIAITREISPNIDNCELTHLARQAIDVELAKTQHRRYEAALQTLGCEVHTLPALAELPDSVFVEDTAIVLEELAIITRPGADSRKPETATIASALEPFRALHFIESPATVDGGDVLHVGKDLYVGLSSRSNLASIEQLHRILEPFGYRVKGVAVKGCLHLKSAVTRVGEGRLLINRNLVAACEFAGVDFIDVDDAEPFAANALLIGEEVLYPASFPRTRERLETAGISVHPVEVSELLKAEGAVTCCSLVFKANGLRLKS